MMELIESMVVPVVTVGCAVFGYILKHYVPMDNKNIPAIMAGAGILLTVGISGYVSIEVTIIGGALSGLAATGAHQVISQWPDKKKED